jgi:hypothetical protein
MRATTTDPVQAYIRPGDEIVNARAEVHTVFAVLHNGHGFSGVVLTCHAGRNGNPRYVLWVVTSEGSVRATMTTDDFPVAHGAFMARAAELVRKIEAEGTRT